MSRIHDQHDLIDKRQARKAFSRAAASYDEAAVLQQEVGRRLLERMDLMKFEPITILDAGAGTGLLTDALARRYRKGRVISLDFALPMLHQARKRGNWFRRPTCLCGDLEHLPLADQSIDLLFSNLALQWVNDLDGMYRECLRVLKPGGLLMFTTFGPDTLKELRAAWSEADGDRQHGHVSQFVDMHNIGDQLLMAGLADPVMDMENIILTYQDTEQLMRDLKSIGAHNVTQSRKRGLTGKGRMQAMRTAYEAFRDKGRLPATYEVVYGHAWAPEEKRQQPTRGGGETRVPISAIRR